MREARLGKTALQKLLRELHSVTLARSGTGIAAFVKTPGRSPVKTRLAHAIGPEAARDFYLASVRAVEAVMKSVASEAITPYWAVAEEEALADPLWQEFPRLAQAPRAQGDDGLGQRLSRVYNELLDRHRFAVLIGTDSPQLSPALLREAIEKTEKLQETGADFVIGPALDGGFYFFAGKRPIPETVWTSVSYSKESTLSELEARLESWLGARCEHLGALRDVDEASDLRGLAEALACREPELLPEQRELLARIERWLA